jgi:hypothetical protein
MKRPGFDKNIIQIWEDIGKRVPFAVQRWSWADNSCVIVYKVEVTKYPYGKCYGVFVRDGYLQEFQLYKNDLISCDGCYQWKYIDEPSEVLIEILEKARPNKCEQGRASTHEGRAQKEMS